MVLQKKERSNTPLLVDWKVTARLEDIEVLFREGRAVEGVIGTILSRMRLQSRSRMSLEVRKPSKSYRIAAVAVALVHMGEVRIRGWIQVANPGSLCLWHISFIWL
jgi:hypothetical protein